MKQRVIAASLAARRRRLASLAAQAQNVAVVNGKPVPKARVDTIVCAGPEAGRARGQQVPPDLEKLVRDKVVLRRDPEPGSRAPRPRRVARLQGADGARAPEHPDRPALAGLRQEEPRSPTPRCSSRIRQVQGAGEPAPSTRRATSWSRRKTRPRRSSPRSRPARSSKTWRRRTRRTRARRRTAATSTSPSPSSYVPEFSQAMTALKKGEMTETPVKTQFGYHIIRLDDTRAGAVPAARRRQAADRAAPAAAEGPGVPRRAAREGEDRLQVHQLTDRAGSA